VFDSGSGHLIIPGDACADKACIRHRRYTEDVAGIMRNADGSRDQLTVNFGTGEVTGVFGRDTICLSTRASSDARAPELCSESRILVATKMSDNPFAEFAFDGVFGLGLPGLSQAVEFNMATQLLATLPPGRRVFSFFFSQTDEGSSLNTKAADLRTAAKATADALTESMAGAGLAEDVMVCKRPASI